MLLKVDVICICWSIWACWAQRSWESFFQAVMKLWFWIELYNAIPETVPTVTIEIIPTMVAIIQPIKRLLLFRDSLRTKDNNVEPDQGSEIWTGTHKSVLCRTEKTLSLVTLIGTLWFKQVYKRHSVQDRIEPLLLNCPIAKKIGHIYTSTNITSIIILNSIIL